MVAITATNSTTPSLQALLSKTRLAQAQREASQAEAHAQDLRAQANQAEREAQDSHARVRDLSSRAKGADPTYTSRVQASNADEHSKPDDVLQELDQFTQQTSLRNNSTLRDILNAIPVTHPQASVKGRLLNESA